MSNKLNKDTINSMVSTLIGIAMNNAYRERQSMIEFLYGASVGKKDQGE